MRTKIPDKFKPTAQSYNNLRKHGAIPDFVDDQLDAFVTYWQETGEKKKSWQMTLQTWMRRAWQGKAGREWEENRHRQRKWGGEKTGLFDEVLDKINGSANRKGNGVLIGEGRSLNTARPTRRLRAAAAPINGSGRSLDNGGVRPPMKRSATPAAAAPMDPLEALRQAREILGK